MPLDYYEITKSYNVYVFTETEMSQLSVLSCEDEKLSQNVHCGLWSANHCFQHLRDVAMQRIVEAILLSLPPRAPKVIELAKCFGSNV